jgi:hypothetical protein
VTAALAICLGALIIAEATFWTTLAVSAKARRNLVTILEASLIGHDA